MLRDVVIMGKGELAVKIARWFDASYKWNLTDIVPVMPEPTWTDSLTKWGIENNVNVIQSGDYRELKQDSFDLVFSVFYDRIIKQDFIDKCDKILNLHNAPLPKYRGMSPINWALKNGETSHGVTIHAIEAGIDTGPIYGQWLFGIDPKVDEVRNVYDRCLYHGEELFLSIINRLDTIVPMAQDESLATYHSADDNCLLWERSGWTREESMPEYFRQLRRLEDDFADRLVMNRKARNE
jgi:methionyl-tRNA formyltransferase